VLCLSAVAIMSAYVAIAPVPTPREPLDGAGWEVQSVMVLSDPGVRTYRLRPPYRVIRGGRVALVGGGADEPTGPVIRLDLTIAGEPVIVFARTIEPEAR
jgi:hypothetical protein